MDRFEAMSMLLEVVDKGNLSAAGRSLKIPLPTLSRRITELETLLGTKLLTRTTRKIALTDAGATYVEAARRILEQVEEAERQASGEFAMPKGELVITAPMQFGRLHVLPVVTDFLAAFPAINVRLMLTDRNIDLVEEHVDMAVRIGNLPDSAMVATRIGSVRRVVCGSPALFAGHGVPKEPADLLGLPCISVEILTPSAGWRFQKPGAAKAIDVLISPRLSVTTTEAAAEAAIRGAGVTRLLYYQVAGAVAAGALKLVLEDFEPEPAPIHLVHLARGQMPLKMRHFLDFAAPRLRVSVSVL
ncbi:DNA-binding transcriptional LysR family regulator [Rhizobium sp. BK316]|uniref:LysR family transcriptional regulator n=1 Tax=Rhizobium sp. BK316 TaxID=2587053 RepID=UPI00161D6E7C|nr:LysR family transcriptional regulator [Rhizobium sp. BK316]MBB3407241.1 DNA-binding transcriptional LysR family regulator [Rhizobium sp. BK316]